MLRFLSFFHLSAAATDSCGLWYADALVGSLVTTDRPGFADESIGKVRWTVSPLVYASSKTPAWSLGLIVDKAVSSESTPANVSRPWCVE